MIRLLLRTVHVDPQIPPSFDLTGCLFLEFQDRTSLILVDSPLSPKTAHFRFYPWDAWHSYCSKRIKLFSVSSFQFQLYFLTSAPTFQLHSIQFNFEHSDLTLSNFCYVFFPTSMKLLYVTPNHYDSFLKFEWILFT